MSTNELTYQVSELPFLCSLSRDGLIMRLECYNLEAGLLLSSGIPICEVSLIGHEDLKVPPNNKT